MLFSHFLYIVVLFLCVWTRRGGFTEIVFYIQALQILLISMMAFKEKSNEGVKESDVEGGVKKDNVDLVMKVMDKYFSGLD